MRNDYITRAESFIKKLYPYLKGKRSWRDIRDGVADFNADHRQQVICKNGVARFAFITSDYVVKMNYGRGHTWAGGCKEEYDRYVNFFANSEFNYLFAPIHKFTYQHRDFYIMPRINGVGTGRYWDKLTKEERRFIWHNVSDMHDNNYGSYKRKPVIIDYAMA